MKAKNRKRMDISMDNTKTGKIQAPKPVRAGGKASPHELLQKMTEPCRMCHTPILPLASRLMARFF